MTHQSIRPPLPTRRSMVRRLLRLFRFLVFGPKHRRRLIGHELARVIAKLLGNHYIGEDYKLWLKDDNFMRQYRALYPHTYFSEERKYALKEFARATRQVEGDLAECGSYIGVSAWFVANELPDIDFFLFDSFEGLSTPHCLDSVRDGLPQWQRGDFQTHEEILRFNLRGFPKVHVLKGWIPDRFPEVSERRFRFVHIDVDLYVPTLESLKFFYPRLNPGGIIVLDDYGFENCPGAYQAAQEFMRDKPEVIIHLPTGQGVIIRHFDADSPSNRMLKDTQSQRIRAPRNLRANQKCP